MITIMIIVRRISSIRMEIIMTITWQYNNDHNSDNDNDNDNDDNYDKECICICICKCVCVSVCVYVYTKISHIYESGISFNLLNLLFGLVFKARAPLLAPCNIVAAVQVQ